MEDARDAAKREKTKKWLLTSTGLESGYGIDPVNHPRVAFAQIELRDAG